MYRFYYGLKKRMVRAVPFVRRYKRASFPRQLMLKPLLSSRPAFSGDGFSCTFNFLNKSVSFSSDINWNYPQHGTLWIYNLTYFDFLLQQDMKKELGLQLMSDFAVKLRSVKAGLDPYPISVRGINWIKFLNMHRINDQRIIDSLYAQYYMLLHNIEYHVLGNHLLENGFSLLWAAYYFQDVKLYRWACKIISQELIEQVQKDGAHFELSPMYHTILLHRLLDTVNLVQHNRWGSDKDLFLLLQEYAGKMTAWLQTMVYSDNTLPLFNDSAPGIAPDPKKVLKYARRLSIEVHPAVLSDSGYRKYIGDGYELLIDVGPLGPEYQPGHAHCDMLHFEMRIRGTSFLVDTGTSTYEAGPRRLYERSTAAHNTVMIDGEEQSELWSSFRVARRAKMEIEAERKNYLKGSCSNYKNRWKTHIREFSMYPDTVIIKDKAGVKAYSSHAFLHFAPSVQIELKDSGIVAGQAFITFEGASYISISSYWYAAGFNRLVEAKIADISFQDELKTKIEVG
ncbi:MAG: heparinase II/III family protein [Spirochaetaceae bacterium]|nr:heparinase II/III family protein [Spirochaetaceae bacterium]